jgi:hypothetical protein
VPTKGAMGTCDGVQGGLQMSRGFQDGGNGRAARIREGGSEAGSPASATSSGNQRGAVDAASSRRQLARSVRAYRALTEPQ